MRYKSPKDIFKPEVSGIEEALTMLDKYISENAIVGSYCEIKNDSIRVEIPSDGALVYWIGILATRAGAFTSSDFNCPVIIQSNDWESFVNKFKRL